MLLNGVLHGVNGPFNSWVESFMPVSTASHWMTDKRILGFLLGPKVRKRSIACGLGQDSREGLKCNYQYKD